MIWFGVSAAETTADTADGLGAAAVSLCCVWGRGAGVAEAEAGAEVEAGTEAGGGAAAGVSAEASFWELGLVRASSAAGVSVLPRSVAADVAAGLNTVLRLGAGGVLVSSPSSSLFWFRPNNFANTVPLDFSVPRRWISARASS